MTENQTNITDEARANFAEMMRDYKGGGGPYIMINLNDLYAEDVYGDEIRSSGKTAATLIQEAVSYEVRQSYKSKIKESVDATCAKIINDELDEEISNAVKAIFSGGFQQGSDGPITTPAEMVSNAMDTWFNAQPNGSSFGREQKTCLKSLINELVIKELSKRTTTLIKDVNREVLDAAKKSVSQTVTDQLFSGMKLLPNIKG